MLKEMIDELNKIQEKQHDALIQEIKEVEEKLASQVKVIHGLQDSVSFLNKF